MTPLKLSNFNFKTRPIKEGETFGQIAKDLADKFGVDRQQMFDLLRQVNPEVTNPNQIFYEGKHRVGHATQLKIPDGFDRREADAAIPGAMSGTVNPAEGFDHTKLLHDMLTNPNYAAVHGELRSELDAVTKAAVGQLPLPERTKDFVKEMSTGLSEEERAVMVAKAHELWKGGYSLEETTRERFAANLRLEMGEYMGSGAKPSGALEERMNELQAAAGSVWTKEMQDKVVGQTVDQAKNMIIRYGDGVAPTTDAHIAAKLPPFLKETYDKLPSNPAEAAQLLELMTRDPRVIQAAKGVTEADIISNMTPPMRHLLEQIRKENPEEARNFVFAEFMDQVDRRTGGKIEAEGALLAHMSPMLRRLYAGVAEQNPNEAYRVLSAVSKNVNLLRAGAGATEESVVAGFNPDQRALFERLQKEDPHQAGVLLLRRILQLANQNEPAVDPTALRNMRG